MASNVQPLHQYIKQRHRHHQPSQQQSHSTTQLHRQSFYLHHRATASHIDSETNGRKQDTLFSAKRNLKNQPFTAKRVRRNTNYTGFITLKSSTLCFILLNLCILGLWSHVAYSEGNVGCHFVRTVCLESSEVCFDDNIFGKCIPTTGVDVEDIEKTPLTEEQSHILATMLEELQGAGLGWDHSYVQCRIQGALFSLQKQTQLPPNLCANLAPTPQINDPASAMAFVRFTPPNEEYVDELYYPPLKKQKTPTINRNNRGINMIFHQLQLQDRLRRHYPTELAHFGRLDAQGSPIITPNIMNAFLENEREQLEKEQLEQEAKLEADRKESIQNRMELYQILAASEPDPEPYQRRQNSPIENTKEANGEEYILPMLMPNLDNRNELYFPENFANYKRTRDHSRKHVDFLEDSIPKRSFFRELASVQNVQPMEPVTRESFGHLQTSDPAEEKINFPVHKRIPNSKDDGTENDLEQFEFEENLMRNSLTPFEEEAMLAANTYPHPHNYQLYKPDHIFTEGGLVYVPKNQWLNDDNTDMFGFKRRERLDVKKPGPLVGPPKSQDQSIDAKTKITNDTQSDPSNSKQATKEVLPPSNTQWNTDELHKKKKVMREHSDEDHASHSVDTEYTHVFVKNQIDSWNDGVRIMNELANILHLQGYFTYLTVQPREISFRVDSNNPERKTASDVARAINENRGIKINILRRLGVSVVRAGVGDKIKTDGNGGVSSSRIELAEQGPDVTHIMAYMFAGAGAAAVIVIFVTLILIKRHDKNRNKLGGLQSGGSAAESCSKDYQELCRARMAGKGNTTEPVASGRITSLSKENDRPPSSRSSTSSWSEEPALTNMDISTGHMVLSYMEDHLRNKGRLQREWEALCRYEAEPSVREAAQLPQCVNFNRTGAPLPYDHSRVVLNHLANAEGLDYINASTITDHDPRAPAYVAAQGPLPTTLSHFWQMIWEQGAVVIVALCRLQENGDVACARYWPEEGAEVYHIYEVHLVSEHIWCDDYLVRSFYLKNLRTSETRTVTQFHFLSWPQSGVPSQAKALLDFRRKVNKSYRGRSCPIVVHGSAGAGRTGAYILLDLVLGRMNKGAREIDIAATLEHLRDQRSGLVANRQQFEFVLMAVAEEVHAILKALPANPSTEKRDLDSKETAIAGNPTKEQEESGKAKEASEVEPSVISNTTNSKVDLVAKAKPKTDKDKENKATPAKGDIAKPK